MTHAFVPARDRPTPDPAPIAEPFTPAACAAVARFYDQRPDLVPTPLVSLPALASSLGVGAVLVKDESHRFGLNAFKLLGARYAIEALIEDGTIAPGQTLVCASEGNHGRAVAHTAARVGCAARVYLSTHVADARVQAIAGEGATIVRVDGTYDDAVRRAAEDAGRHGWTVVSDTAWPGYERIPHLIMLGYTRLMDEVARALPDARPPSAVFVPTGVGGLLAAVAAWTHLRWGRTVQVVSVEPASAACMLASARAGRPTAVSGPFTTVLGPLRCGEVSTAAFDAAYPHVAAYLGIDDEWALRAIRVLARPSRGDAPIEAGATGGAALGGLLAMREAPEADQVRETVHLGPDSTVVLIVSEGMTDPALWHAVVGET